MENYPVAIERWFRPGVSDDLVRYILINLDKSKSQLQQDLLVKYIYEKIVQLGEKVNPTFVEFGAASGVALSNTYFLEKHHGWTGLLCEPHPGFHKSIVKNRKCELDKRCLSENSGETVDFLLVDNPELSTIKNYSDSDLHSASRLKSSVFQVTTVSLTDLIKERFEGKEIFYLSADTEGSEYEILSAYDFEKCPRVISVEHNFTDNDEKIEALLESHGYSRILREFSNFDAWYIHKSPNFERDYLS